MRVLVVEDNPVTLKMLVGAIQRMGHDVVSAENGLDAWNILQDEPIKLVVADWVMPEMDGLELIRRIRDHSFEHYTYVVLLTARGERMDCVAGLQAGADDYMVKPFDPDELEVRLQAGERVIRLEEQLAARNRRLEELTVLDELTQVGNRRGFGEAYERLLAQARRYNVPASLAMIDIDRFKAYNDTHGHEAGDEVLRRVAAVIAANVRSADMVFRYGGEEFVCLFPMTGWDGAATITERLRTRIVEAGIPHPENQPHGVITISVGYACVDGGESTEIGDLLGQADEALYRCKAEGRNCCERFQAQRAAG